MVHRKGGYKCTHKSQNHRSRSLPQTPISVMESSKPGIESCSKWLLDSGTGSNMVHNKVGYDMCILNDVQARNQIITVVSVKLRLFELLLGNTAIYGGVWREKERKGSSAITVSPTDQQRRNLNREEKWSTGLKGTFMEGGLVPSAGDRRGRGFRRDPHRGTQLG